MLNFLKKLQNFLLIVFLFLLPWQTRLIIKDGSIGNEYWEYGTLSLYLSDILLVIIIILRLINHRLEKLKANFNKNDLLLLVIFILGAGFNIYFSQNKILSLFHFGWLILALSLFIILRQAIIPHTVAVLSLIWGAALSSLLGAWQFITQKTFALKWLGLAQHQADDLGTSVVEAIAPDGFAERWLRAYGSLDHPNMLAGLVAIAIFFCLYLVFSGRTKEKREVIVMSAFIILIAGLMATLSRAGLIGASLGLIIYFIFSIKQSFKIKLKQIAPFIIMGAITITLFVVPYYYLLIPRFTFNTRLEKISTTERIASYKEAWPIIKNNSLVGVGLGNYGLALEKNIPEKIVWFYQPIHNTWLLLLVETGLVGLIIWLWFITKKTVASWKQYSEDRIIIFGTLIILLTIGLFDHWLMSLHFGIMLSAASLGLALKK